MRMINADWRNEMRMASAHAEGDFSVFMRRNEDFPENFSIGLRYHPRDERGEIILFRCNGPHGEFNGRFDPLHPHWEFHVHKATAAAIDRGFRPERFAEKTDKYAAYEEALYFFLSQVGISENDIAYHFPGMNQRILDFEGGLNGNS